MGVGEAGSMKRSFKPRVSGCDVRMRYAAPSHTGGLDTSKGRDAEGNEIQYLPTLVRLDYLNMELSAEERAELRWDALASCIGTEANSVKRV